jgi:hypothetical protein
MFANEPTAPADLDKVNLPIKLHIMLGSTDKSNGEHYENHTYPKINPAFKYCPCGY